MHSDLNFTLFVLLRSAICVACLKTVFLCAFGCLLLSSKSWWCPTLGDASTPRSSIGASHRGRRKRGRDPVRGAGHDLPRPPHHLPRARRGHQRLQDHGDEADRSESRWLWSFLRCSSHSLLHGEHDKLTLNAGADVERHVQVPSCCRTIFGCCRRRAPDKQKLVEVMEKEVGNVLFNLKSVLLDPYLLHSRTT